MDRVILHSDINSCYASVERLFDPHLGERPFAVCGSTEERHGIVLAKDEKAKAAGVKTGMAIWQAKRLCPELETVRPHFERYAKYSEMVREIYSEYTNICEPFGIDENWLDITGCLSCPDPAMTAQEIRRRVKQETGLTVSIGVSWNKVFAKLGSDYKKPDAVTVIDRERYRQTVWPLPASALLMVGRSTRRELARMGIRTIGEIACADPELLTKCFGKSGISLWRYANGLDDSRVRRAGEEELPQSVGNSITLPYNIENETEARRTLIMLAESIGERLRKQKLMCRTVEVDLRSEQLSWQSHRVRLRYATDVTSELYTCGFELVRRCHDFSAPLHSLGLRALELVHAEGEEQMDMFTDYVNLMKQRSIDRTVDKIRGKYGEGVIQRACLIGDAAAANLAFCALPD